jgi:insertion element IS1 protein InsB
MRCIPVLVQKNDCWIWIAIDRYGKRFINFIIGDRSNETAKAFWEKIKDTEMKYIANDYWKPSESIISRKKHLQTKAETYTVEGYNSLFRLFLARMRRKSKC